MNQLLRFLLAGLTMLLASWSTAQTIIPFTLEQNTIYLYCKVNDTDSIRFLFDTGANGSVINEQALGKLPLKIDGNSLNTGSNGSNQVTVSAGNTIVLGGITKTNVSLTIIPFGTTDFDGVFGTDLMKDHIVEIDYSKNELRFYDSAAFKKELSGYEQFKIHLIDDYPAIESTLVINGKKVKGLFGLDTGADDAITIASPFAKTYDLNAKMNQIGAATYQGSDGSSYEMPIMSLDQLKFGKKCFYEIPTSLSTSAEGIDATTEMSGFFGNNFLKRFNTVIDFEKGCIYFKPSNHLHTPYFE